MALVVVINIRGVVGWQRYHFSITWGQLIKTPLHPAAIKLTPPALAPHRNSSPNFPGACIVSVIIIVASALTLLAIHYWRHKVPKFCGSRISGQQQTASKANQLFLFSPCNLVAVAVEYSTCAGAERRGAARIGGEQFVCDPSDTSH